MHSNPVQNERAETKLTRESVRKLGIREIQVPCMVPERGGG